jgi:hypothetical protein
MKGWYLNNELERIWKEAVPVYFFFIIIPRGSEESYEKNSVRITGLRAGIWTREFSNAKQWCQPLDDDAR